MELSLGSAVNVGDGRQHGLGGADLGCATLGTVDQPDTAASIATRAGERFARLRSLGLDAVGSGTLDAQVARGDGRPPDGWCVSTVGRVVRQDTRLADRIEMLQRRIAAVGPCFSYHRESLHVSLLGLTQREPIDRFGPDRSARLGEAVHAVLASLGPVEFSLGGLNLLGTQWFIEVVPVDRSWAEARLALARAMLELGETPMSHPDPEPVHLNVARATGPIGDVVAACTLLDPAAAEAPLGPLVVRHVDVVVTDFVVSPERTTTVTSIELGSGRGR